MSTTQIGGDHYAKLKIQPMDFSMANGLDALQHSIIKYVVRFRNKGGLQDLEKAKHCINMLIEWENKHKAIADAEAAAVNTRVAAIQEAALR